MKLCQEMQLLTSTTTVELKYLKVKDKKHNYWSNQKLLHHFQHVKYQLNSLIYSSDKQILGLRTYKFTEIFDRENSITIKITFSLPD